MIQKRKNRQTGIHKTIQKWKIIGKSNIKYCISENMKKQGTREIKTKQNKKTKNKKTKKQIFPKYAMEASIDKV